MARPANPHREVCLTWMREHPDATASEAASRFAVSPKTVENWVKWSRTRPDLGAVPVPMKKMSGGRGRPSPNLTILPPPPKQLPDDLADLARQAVRLRLQRLADPELVASENSRDLRDGLSMLTSTYEFLGPMSGKKSEEKSFTARLLGAAPEEDVEDDEATG